LDGNGRTGRIINILYLVLNNLLELPVLFHSKAIIENKKDYYQLLNKVTMKNDWEPWIIYMLDVIEETARLTSQKILAIYRLMQETTERVQRVFSKRVNTKGLVEILFHQPYTKGQFLVNANIAERKTAAEYLKELEKKGILQSYKIGKEILYLNVGLYDLLSQ
jgi:Fic family protein